MGLKVLKLGKSYNKPGHTMDDIKYNLLNISHRALERQSRMLPLDV